MSYKVKLLLYFSVLFAVFAAVLVGFQWQREKQFRRERLESRLQVYADMSAELHATESPDSLAAAFRRLRRMMPEDLRITVIDYEGKVQLDYPTHRLHPLTNHRERPEVRAAFSKGEGSDVRLSATAGIQYFYYAKRYRDSVVRVAFPYDRVAQSLLQPDSVLLWFVLLVFPFATVALVYTADRFGQSVETLRQFVDSAERGLVDYAHIRFPKTELGLMARKVVETYRRAEEGRLAVEREREKKRIFKQQMTNNITHELRTPVAAIQGFLETLVRMPDLPIEQRTFFLSRAFAQCRRLSELIRDASLISKMEEAADTIPRELLNLFDIVEEVRLDIAATASAQSFALDNRISERTEICGNHSLIYAVFRNLMENSVKYAIPCHCVVECVGEDDTHIFLRYYDKGSGVSEEHLPRIFERFYRADEGRTRHEGGTGLGLSIVRNAVAIHGGTIRAERHEEGGLQLSFSLAKG